MSPRKEESERLVYVTFEQHVLSNVPVGNMCTYFTFYAVLRWERIRSYRLCVCGCVDKSSSGGNGDVCLQWWREVGIWKGRWTTDSGRRHEVDEMVVAFLNCEENPKVQLHRGNAKRRSEKWITFNVHKIALSQIQYLELVRETVDFWWNIFVRSQT